MHTTHPTPDQDWAFLSSVVIPSSEPVCLFPPFFLLSLALRGVAMTDLQKRRTRGSFATGWPPTAICMGSLLMAPASEASATTQWMPQCWSGTCRPGEDRDPAAPRLIGAEPVAGLPLEVSGSAALVETVVCSVLLPALQKTNLRSLIVRNLHIGRSFQLTD